MRKLSDGNHDVSVVENSVESEEDGKSNNRMKIVNKAGRQREDSEKSVAPERKRIHAGNDGEDETLEQPAYSEEMDSAEMDGILYY